MVEGSQGAQRRGYDVDTGFSGYLLRRAAAQICRCACDGPHTAPVPYFQRLEKFYLGLAAANIPTETPPDLKKSGETPEFYALALPIPDQRPPLGDLKFTDLRFKFLLTRAYANDGKPDDEIATAAEKYAGSSADALNQYLDQIRAALLDPDNQGGWPFRSYLVSMPVSRTLMMQQLTGQMKDRNAPDWAIQAYAMIYLKLMSGDPGAAAGILEDLGKISPYLARSAGENAFLGKNYYPGRVMAYLKPVRQVMSRNAGFMGDVPAVYKWATGHVLRIALATQEIKNTPPASPVDILTSAPYAEMMALENSPAFAPVKKAAPAPGGQNAVSDADDGASGQY